MNDDNPFRVLGVPIGIMMSLTPAQLKMFVKDIYRSMQKIYHPDKGGDNERTQKLNAAMVTLNDETSFITAWHEFVSNPDPAASSMRAEVESLRSRLASIQGDATGLERQSSIQRTEIKRLEDEAGALAGINKMRIEDALHSSRMAGRRQLDGLEIRYHPMMNATIGSMTRTMHIIDNTAFAISARGGQRLDLGRVIGTLNTDGLFEVLSRTGRKTEFPIGAFIDVLAGHIRPRLENESAIVCEQAGNARIIGVIDSVKASQYAVLSGKKAADPEMARRLRIFTDMILSGRSTPLGLAYDYYAGRFNGMVEMDDNSRIIVKDGVVSTYSGKGVWSGSIRIVGSLEPGAALAFMQSVKGKEADFVRNELKAFVRQGMLAPLISEQKMLVAMDEKGLMLLSKAEKCIHATDIRLADRFNGLIILDDQNESGTDRMPSAAYLCEGGVISEIDQHPQLELRLKTGKGKGREAMEADPPYRIRSRPLGTLAGSIKTLEGEVSRGIILPWLDEGNAIVCVSGDGKERVLGPCKKLDFLIDTSARKRDAKIREAIDRCAARKMQVK